jgi:hypothetical protein
MPYALIFNALPLILAPMGVWPARGDPCPATRLWRRTPSARARVATSLDSRGVAKVQVLAKEAVRFSSHGARRRPRARFALMAVRKMGHQTLRGRLAPILRHAVVRCVPRISPCHGWHHTTWPAFSPALPRAKDPQVLSHSARRGQPGPPPVPAA